MSTIREVLDRMEELRRVNAGRLLFVMTPDGQALAMAADGLLTPCELPADGPSNYTELFYVKGMAAAASVLRAVITERVQPGVVYTTFHFPSSGANVITTDNSDWATNCPEYKVTEVQVTQVTEPSRWQKEYRDRS